MLVSQACVRRAAGTVVLAWVTLSRACIWPISGRMLPVMAEAEDSDTAHVLASVPHVVEMLGPPARVHRIVESIEFLDESRVRRQVGVDLTVPHSAQACGSGQDVYLPLQVVLKAPIRNLDLVDGFGRAVPVLTAEQNARLSGEVLIEQARVYLGGKPSEPIQEVLRKIANFRNPTKEAMESILERLEDPDIEQFELLSEAPSVFIKPLWNGFLLVGQVQATRGDRVLIKRSYEEEFKMSGGHGRFTTEALFAGDSYHLELLAPEGTVIADARMSVTVEGDAASHERPSRHVVGADSKVDRAHIYAKADVVADKLGAEPTASVVEVWLRPRPPMVEPVLFVSLFVTATLISGAWAKHEGWITDVPNGRRGDRRPARPRRRLPRFGGTPPDATARARHSDRSVLGGDSLVRRCFRPGDESRQASLAVAGNQPRGRLRRPHRPGRLLVYDASGARREMPDPEVRPSTRLRAEFRYILVQLVLGTGPHPPDRGSVGRRGGRGRHPASRLLPAHLALVRVRRAFLAVVDLPRIHLGSGALEQQPHARQSANLDRVPVQEALGTLAEAALEACGGALEGVVRCR